MSDQRGPEDVALAAGDLIGEEAEIMLSAGYFDEYTMAGALDQAGLLATDWTVTRRIESVIRRMEDNGSQVAAGWARQLRIAIATSEPNDD